MIIPYYTIYRIIRYYHLRREVLRRRRSTSKGTAASSNSSWRIALENFCRLSHISVCLNFPFSTACSNRATVDGLTCSALLILYVDTPLPISNIISSRLASMTRSVLVSNSLYSCFLVLVLVFANASNSRLSSSASFADESCFDETCGIRILYDISYSITSYTCFILIEWCPGWDLNPQSFRREILSLLCIPFHHPGVFSL